MWSFLWGMPIIENISLIVSDKLVQKRTHKWKWLNKIYAKLYGYRQLMKPDPDIYIMGNKIVGHPETIKAMLELVNKI